MEIKATYYYYYGKLVCSAWEKFEVGKFCFDVLLYFVEGTPSTAQGLLLSDHSWQDLGDYMGCQGFNLLPLCKISALPTELSI